MFHVNLQGCNGDLLQEVLREVFELRLIRSIKGIDGTGSTHCRDASLLVDVGRRDTGVVAMQTKKPYKTQTQ